MLTKQFKELLVFRQKVHQTVILDNKIQEFGTRKERESSDGRLR